MLALLLAPLLAATNGARGPAPLVLYPLQSKGLDADATRSIDASLRAQMDSMERFKLLSRGETDSVLRPPGGGLGLSCESGDDDCLAGVGRLLGGGVVAFGRLNPDGAALWLVDAKTSAEVRRVQIRGPPLDAAREAAVALLTPDRYVGLLAVEGTSGRLAVDGVSRGDLPLPSPLVLQVGKHTVTLTIPGQSSSDVAVDVHFGQTSVVSASNSSHAPISSPAPAPVAPAAPSSTAPAGEAGRGWTDSSPTAVTSPSPLRTIAYFALGAGVLSLGAGIACGAVSEDNANALQGLQRPVPLSMYGTVNQDAQRTLNFAIAADVLFGAAAVLGVTGVVLYLVGGNTGSSAGTGGAGTAGNHGGAALTGSAGLRAGGLTLEPNGVSIAF